MSSDIHRTVRRIALLTIGTFCVLVEHASSPIAATPRRVELTVAAAVERARAALGWDAIPADGAVRVRGAARLRGIDVLQTDVFDRRGRTLQTFEGKLSQSGGFDGTDAWTVAWTGTGRLLVLGDLATARVSSALLSGAWSAPSDELEFLSVDADKDAVELVFVHVSGLVEGIVELDPESYLPRAARTRAGVHDSIWSFSEYRDHGGFRFPGSVTIEQAGLVSTLSTEAVELLDTVGDDVFAKRLERPRDTLYAADIPAALEVKRVPTGHLLVHPSIDGKDLGWFIFDSGAGTNCISTHVADQLAEGPFGSIPAQGIGGTVLSHFWRANSLTLGPVTIEDPIFMGLDLSFLKAPFGVDVAGILGYEFLARCTVEFDLVTPSIAVFDPETYELRNEGLWEEALLYGRHPCVRAGFEGREGVFKIDTGAAGDTVTLHYDIVELLHLTEGRETSVSHSGGVGGTVAVRDGQLGSFVFGGRDFGTIDASFAIEDKGAFSDASTWGNIGGKLLEPFVLVFDYPRERIGFILKDPAD